MNQMVNLNTASTLTMSSREIAELTGKTHDNVRRDVRNMAQELSLKLEEKVVPSTGGRPSLEYLLPKRETLILVSGYSVTLRTRIIDRWMELEAKDTHQPVTMLSIPNFADPAEAAIAWAAEWKAKQLAEQKFEEAKPQLAIAERVVSHNHSLSRFIRTLDGINQKAIKKDLMRLGYFYKQGGTYRVYAKHRNVFTEKALAEFGSVDIFPTAEGKALLVQLYEAGKLTMRKGCDEMGRPTTST
ncbi:Rha family transcriptional regulator [Rhizobium lemnae]|uniref:Rha family transcriptional regulator n=1 Tax=Rhizobium lemnae TaxID=1214924 RepID=A0ABV8E502_9HYPH|nr:Rha family transcriptional regulator [Rhizobium lemnae]MCJ8507946.1 Rha family transcriptional regulator [Rhizobium lemnae]